MATAGFAPASSRITVERSQGIRRFDVRPSAVAEQSANLDQAAVPVRGRNPALREIMDTTQRMPRPFLTEAGLIALHAMMNDGRLVDPVKYAHVRQEVGIGPTSLDSASRTGLGQSPR